MKLQRYCQKLVLNLGVIGLEVALIWVVYNLFAHNWLPLIAVISFFITLGGLIALLKIANSGRFRWQRPSILKTTIAIIMIILVCTFAGVEPMSAYKDRVFTSVTSTLDEWEQASEIQEAEEGSREVEEVERVSEEDEQKPLLPPWGERDIDTSPTDTPVVTPCPQGVYIATGLYGGLAVVFEGNRLTTDFLYGKIVYRYEITQDGAILSGENVVTGGTEKWRFKYIEEEDCVILDDIPFWGENPIIETEGYQTPDASIGKDEKQIFALINQERIEEGLSCVTWSYLLHSGARDWSEHMQTEGKLYHDTSGNFAECCYGASWSSYRTPEQTVAAWMASSGHRAILLGRYSYGAVGLAQDNGFFATYRCE